MNKHALENDPRVVMTLDAGGTNFVFSALRGFKELVAPIRKESHANDLDRCLENVIRGFEEVNDLLEKKADAISFVDPDDKKQIGIEIHSGRNRVIRRIFEHLGYNVIKLDRVYFAGLTKKGLSRGQWRYLTNKEISVLKKGSYK